MRFFSEAAHEYCNMFLHLNHDKIRPNFRPKWYCQAVDAVAHVHSQGIIYSDSAPMTSSFTATLLSSNLASLRIWMPVNSEFSHDRGTAS
ncbi:hypothetical protein B0T11DRAFT_290513 [Plectosphaerella cucumerina]|uniref:Protein kinase domain-containing protein n=1 Tax=Plectosphaerella cucumerina TaxID=40658 RepID=A0A8K0TB10_9PEZI|nr:hypothetical protein B0T11DRAFT_290513 [Plectosphaerella cucumerina]